MGLKHASARWRIGTVLLFAVGTALTFLARVQSQDERRYRHAWAVRAVGEAALAYLHETGTPPESVDDLIAAGLLVQAPSGEWMTTGGSLERPCQTRR